MSKQIIITIVIFFLIAAVFILIWSIKSGAPSEEIAKGGPILKKETGEKGEVIFDCGTSTLENPEQSKQVLTCWEEKFKQCQPAKFVSVLPSVEGQEPIVYYSEILGLGEGEHVCRVKSKFLENPNIEWINKEMICNYDNSVAFDFAIQDLLNRCSGPLFDVITKGKK